jgi:hypothetical protein
MEKMAGAPGASPPITPTAAFAASVVVLMPWSSIVRLSMTSTAAGVSRAVIPSREPTSVTTSVSSGVLAALASCCRVTGAVVDV